MKNYSFVCFSVNNWEKRKARKQQFMLHLSKRDDVDGVMYIEPHLNFFRLLLFPFIELQNTADRGRWRRALTFSVYPVSGKLFVFTPIFFIPFSHRFQLMHNINLFISSLFIKFKLRELKLNNVVLWLYHPFDYIALKLFKNRVLSVFDWAEEWAEYFIELSKRRADSVKKLEVKIISDSDLVFVVSAKMLDMALKLNLNSCQMLDGTVFEYFKPDSSVFPEELKNLSKPVIGYVGTVGSRVDTEILEHILQSMPSCSLVILGDLHNNRVDFSSLRKYQNLHLLGGKEYLEIGKYMQHFDITILPYKPVLTASFPTKLMDYFASGKPTVSTDLVEIRRFADLLYIAKSKDEFVLKIKQAIQEDSRELELMRLETARANTWKLRASEIIELIKGSAKP